MSKNVKTYHLSFLYKLNIDEDQISATYDFRTHKLLWHEIRSIRPNPKGEGLLLSNSGEDTVIFINSNLREYSEVVKIIQEKCSGVWNSQDINTFHYSPLRLILFGLSGLMTVLYPILFSSNSTGKDLVFTTLEIVVGLFLLWYAFTAKQKLFFQGDSIVFKYIAWKHQIHARDIDSILHEKIMFIKTFNKIFHFTIQAPVIELKNGKKVNFGIVTEGKSILLNSIEKWKKKHLKST